MAFATTDDGVRLYFEETGSGPSILFIHEFAGDHRSWAPQVRHFAGRYRCIAYNARGYPPSEVPESIEAYSQQRAVADAIAVLDEVGIERAHIVGLSMGGFCALHLGLQHPERAHSLVVAGCGYGATPSGTHEFSKESAANADGFEYDFEANVDRYGHGPTRVQLEAKNPRVFAEFLRQLGEHSPIGSALTLRGVQMRRPNLYDLREQLARLSLPTLVVTGDEDEPCLEPDLMLKRTIPGAALAVIPKTGHACNLEEPALFNSLVDAFLVEVAAPGNRRSRSARRGCRPPA
ncbi:MAG TPA: alpha/beta hydrolase [Candidatus Dormibacteraeota bacterium]